MNQTRITIPVAEHRGIPNESNQTRIVLVTTHHIFWRRRSEQIRARPSAQPLFSELPLDTKVQLPPEDFDYLIQQEACQYARA